MFKNKEKRDYTNKHRKAFRAVEKILLGHNTLRGYLHDIDKPILYCFLEVKLAHHIHVATAWHHKKKAKSLLDYFEMVVDWECARFTKPDKPLNAYDTLYKFYPELEDEILPILRVFELDHSGKNWLDDYKDFILERIAA